MTTKTAMKINLRALEPEDIDLLYQVENDSCIWEAGNNNMPYSRQILREYILNTTGDIYTDKQLRLIIESSESSHEPIGILDLTNFDPRNNRAEVGITVLSPYRQHGYATEALAELEKYASQTIHMHQIYAIVPAENTPSLKLFTKCGFTATGELEDWLYDGKTYKNALLMQKIL